MPESNTAQTTAIISDERAREAVRRELDRAINIDRRFTRPELSQVSGVNIHMIDQMLSRDPAKHRRITLSDSLSLAWVLGPRSINAVLGLIGYVAKPIDDADTINPMMIAAGSMAQLSVIASAAADGRIDHTEVKACRDAADALIAIVTPLSSAGEVA